ncbi:hypothetical protein BCR42DRAFT_418721 [Absidia repens]|uniref:Uncharacterized protein n=1 Tax=Absidia repens TaxID=90262 RepID=A0A1X2IBY2_9FUNG|nr:hypothetical protein BCR42DRAFT_418721 [Absidia repens]
MDFLYTNDMDLSKSKFHQPNYCDLPHSSHLYNQTCDFCPSLDSFGTSLMEDDSFDLTSINNYSVFGYLAEQTQPFKYTYLLNLFTTPNMTSYLAEASITDDVYALPIHLQRLLMEAKEEVVFGLTTLSQESQPSTTTTTNQPALKRLERVRSFCWLRSDADVSNLMSTVSELVADDDELEHILID